MSAIVHYGGAGTLAAGLRAGLPTQIIPFFGDQSFWGRRVAKVGAALPLLEKPKISAETLAKALTALEEMRRSAQSLSDAIETDPGAGAAVDFLERRVASSQWSRFCGITLHGKESNWEAQTRSAHSSAWRQAKKLIDPA